MDTNSNKYTFIFAIVMVLIVATLLSVAAISLKPFQAKNVEIEKKTQILTSVEKGLEASEAENKNAYIEAEYDKYITKSYTVNVKGEQVEGNAFLIDLQKEYALPLEEQRLPVFECQEDDGSIKYVFPIRGKGLWGPIWGYIALKDDMNTVLGAIFDHKGETPGLGAEINTGWFQAPFKGKQIFDGSGKFASVAVVKGGAAPGDLHAVDAISGGTITSVGVSNMIFDSMSKYEKFLKNSK
jgi:Na+-transporting NADH:ubiquinone oxidoreductase subunit C